MNLDCERLLQSVFVINLLHHGAWTCPLPDKVQIYGQSYIMYQIYKKVLCYCTKFQENINPDKEETTLKKSVAYAQPLAVALAINYEFLYRFSQRMLRHSHKECWDIVFRSKVVSRREKAFSPNKIESIFHFKVMKVLVLLSPRTTVTGEL